MELQRTRRRKRSLPTTGHNSLMLACQKESKEDVRNILDRQPGVAAQRDPTGKNALHYCAENTNVDCASRILSAIPALLSAPDDEGYTPLHLAVISGNKAMVKYLLTRGADPCAVDSEKHSCVHWATVSGDCDCLDLLISSGADPSTPDIHGAYPVHYAAQMCGPNSEMGNDVRIGLAVLRTLLSKKINVACVDRDGRPPLLWAASGGSSDAILALVKAGADVNATDREGLTALHCAASRGHADCLDTLVSLCGAEVDKIDDGGCSALFYAAATGHADCTNLLLTYGAQPDRQDNKGRTPAHCGAAKGQLETLKILAHHKANLWVRNAKGDMPLHEAVQSGRKDLIEWLLKLYRGSVNVSNVNGRTPLHIAAITNNVDMCKVLMDYGAFVNPIMRNSKGLHMTPMDAALHRGNRSCAKYLSLHGALPASKLLEKREYRFTEIQQPETVELSPNTQRRIVRDSSAQTESQSRDVDIQARVDLKNAVAETNDLENLQQQESRPREREPCGTPKIRCPGQDGTGKPIIAKVYVHTKRSRIKRMTRKSTGFRRESLGDKLLSRQRQTPDGTIQGADHRASNNVDMDTTLQMNQSRGISVRKASQPTLFEEPQRELYEERQRELFEEQQQKTFEEQQQKLFEEQQRELLEEQQRTLYEQQQREFYEARQRELYEQQQGELYEEQQRHLYEEQQRNLHNEQQRQIFEEQQRNLHNEQQRQIFEEQQRNLFEEQQRHLYENQQSPEYEEIHPPVDEEEQPLLEDQDQQDVLDEELPDVPPQSIQKQISEEQDDTPSPVKESQNLMCDCCDPHDGDESKCDCNCHEMANRTQRLSIDKRRRSSFMTPQYDTENQSPLSSIRSIESTIKDSGFSDDVDRSRRHISSSDEGDDFSDSEYNKVRRKKRHVARYIVSSGAAETFRLDEDDEEDENKVVVKPRSSSLPHFKKKEDRLETCPRLLNRPTITKEVQRSLKKYQMERRLFYELQELKRKQITTLPGDERDVVLRMVSRFRNYVLGPSMTDFQGPHTFPAFEKYLYEQLRKLSMGGRIPKPKAVTKERGYATILPPAELRDSRVLCTCNTHRCHHKLRKSDTELNLNITDTSNIPLLPDIIQKDPMAHEQQSRGLANRSKSWDRLEESPRKMSNLSTKFGKLQLSNSLPSLSNPFPRRVPAALLAAISEKLGPDVHPEDTVVVEMTSDNINSKMRHAFTVQELQEIVSRYEEQAGRKVKPIPLETVIDPDVDEPITFEIRHGKERNVFRLPAGKLKDNKKWQVTFTIGKKQKDATSIYAK